MEKKLLLVQEKQKKQIKNSFNGVFLFGFHNIFAHI